MATFCTKLTTVVVLFLALCIRGYALPSLGLTQISADSTLRPNLEVINGSAYLGVAGGVWTVDTFGSQAFIPISHPTLGTPLSVTRVVKAFDEKLYVAANFPSSNSSTQLALYRLDAALALVATWDGSNRAAGVARDLTVYGNNILSDSEFEAAQFNIDGTSKPLARPSGPNFNNGTSLSSSTPLGNAIGLAGIPGTAGIGPVKWEPNGDISFIDKLGVADSIRDRADGNGANIGWYDFVGPIVSYGEGRSLVILKQDGSSFYEDSPFTIRTLVSHGDSCIVEVFTSPFQAVSSLYVFSPGIVPGFSDRAMPLLDIFPELSTIDIDFVSDLASVDGYLYMTLSGADGTFLFGAHDPSVIIPEPASAVLALLAAAALLRRARPIPLASDQQSL